MPFLTGAAAGRVGQLGRLANGVAEGTMLVWVDSLGEGATGGLLRVGGADAVRRAVVRDGAGAAGRRPGMAATSAVPDQTVRQARPVFLGDEFGDLELDLDRVFALGPAKTTHQAAKMGVDRQPRDVEGIAEDDIGRLTSDAGQRHEVLEFLGHLALVAVGERLAEAEQAGGLVPVEPRRLDQSLKFTPVSGGQVGWRRVLGAQGGGDHIDPFVGALGRQNRRDNQLIRVLEVQFAVGVRVGLLQDPVDLASPAYEGGMRLGGLRRGHSPRLRGAPTACCLRVKVRPAPHWTRKVLTSLTGGPSWTTCS